ncbi:MAG TPA: GDP-L-fucose synthase [Caulobacteraceae bacterium]|nr:GDP-L-fucose synthase [Caulobacteraceae bacterium]
MVSDVIYPLAGRRVWVAGHSGLVGQALLRRLARENCEMLTASRVQVDLRRQAEVERWMDAARPDAILLAAGTVGGILANSTRPTEFLYDNLTIAANVIEAARRADTGKLLFLGSSCIYPRAAAQPIGEDALLTGPLEPTNEAYAIAKIAGLKLTQACRAQYGCDFISAMPTNLYGPGDNFDLESSHVLPALLRKTHDAKQRGEGAITVWGTGAPRREFLHVDDCADALVFLLQRYSAMEPVNVGVGEDVTIGELAELVRTAVGFAGEIRFDHTKPDGMPRKRLDVTRLRALGWRPAIGLSDGIAETYRWFERHEAATAA